MSTIPIQSRELDRDWHPPSRGEVGMYSLIVAETAMFAIFVVAYIYYIGKSDFGPTPEQVLKVPVLGTICLLSSSVSIWLSERAIDRNRMSTFTLWWAITFLLGAIFIGGTALEWRKLIYRDGFTIRTNLFGTTFYSLVGLHASHVIVGLTLLLTVLAFTLTGHVHARHAYRIKVLAMYWHFVDAVWVVVFTVVYLIGR
jgi:cytochrome c oxidase subunit 3/cytochrome o ubiquinol oxidase subunit 3